MSFQSEVWTTLSSIDCSKQVEKKGQLSYLSWAWAWGILMENYPESRYAFHDVHTFPDGTAEIWVDVTVRKTVENDDGEPKKLEWRQSMWLPILDYKNQPIKNFNAFNINTTRMRVLTKALAMFGLGHYIYAGEDMPRPEPPVQDAAPKDNSVAAVTAQESLEGIDHATRDDYLYAIREALHNDDNMGLFQILDEMDNDMKVAVWAKLQGGRGGEKSDISRRLKEREEPTSSTVATMAQDLS